MIRHIIFDLDDTLIDTTGLLIPIKDSPLFLKTLSNPLPLLPGAYDNLTYLKNKNYQLHLLTQGRPHLQKLKIQNTNIEPFFASWTICDPSLQQTKAQYFNHFLHTVHAHPNQIMSIGNRRSTDLEPAKKLGYQTCWFAYGEHIDEIVTSPFAKPDFIIHNHFEMIKVCKL